MTTGLLLGLAACGGEADSSSDAPPAVTVPEDPFRDRVVAAALSAIDTTSLPWPFIQSFMVNTTMSGLADPFVAEGDPTASPLDLLGIQERGFGLCTACADSTRLAHAWVTLATPVQESTQEWLVPYTLSVQRWGTRAGQVRIRCLGGACRAVDGALDSLEVPTPACCPVFVRVRRERR